VVAAGMTLRGEGGFTLVEMLVVLVLSFVVLGATLTTFTNFNQVAHDNDTRNDTVEVARNALDAQARQLRNLAKRVASPVIDRISGYDLIFQSQEPSKTWVRYCLDTTTSPASTDRARLWKAELAVPTVSGGPVAAPASVACPGTGWTTTSVVADYVTNRSAGNERPLFTYRCRSGTACAASATTYDQVVGITAETFVDTTPSRGAPETGVVSAVYLRNQNQAPVASFVSSPTSDSRTIVLNASASTDFEGRTMSYYWFKQSMPATASIDCADPDVTGDPGSLWGSAGFIGTGITLNHTFSLTPVSDGVAGSTRTIGLVVCDAGDRPGVPPLVTSAVAIPT